MLDLLAAYDFHGGEAARTRLVAAIEAYVQATLSARGRGDREALRRAETDVKAAPRQCIRINALGDATLYAVGRTYQAGRFEVLRLRELRARAQAARQGAGDPPARVRLWILDGASPATDIGALQAAAPPGSLFQVASQFNCLEAPGAFVTDVADYLHDPTQGPRASVSAFPGTLLRHYAAPDASGQRFVQRTDGPQLNLLSDVCAAEVAHVHSGYLRLSDVAQPRAFAQALEQRFESIAVGVHDGVQVVLGADWDGAVEGAPFRTIAQVFTSTLAAGMYGQLQSDIQADDAEILRILRALQRAAYLGTLLAAAALGKDRAILTLIGGGVFGNPLPVIWDAIQGSLQQIEPLLHRDLLVVINGRNLSQQISADDLRAAARARGGSLIRFDRSPVVF